MYINGGVGCDWWSLHSHTAARNRTVVCLQTDTAVSNRERKGEKEAGRELKREEEERAERRRKGSERERDRERG